MLQKKDQNIDQNTSKKLKYNYIDKSLNSSLNKQYQSPQKREKSFNCGRRITIEGFSPYRNIHREHGIIKQNLLQEISMQNQLLNHQVLEYKSILLRQQQQIAQKQKQIKYLQQKNIQQRLMFEGVIADMKEQIKTVLQKNTILERQVARVTNFGIKQNYLIDTPHKASGLSQEIYQILNCHYKKIEAKSSGKDLESDEQAKKYLQSIIKRTSTVEQLIKSISQMHTKIEQKPLQINQLKSLWKWLKLLGQEHNYLKKIRKPLARKLSVDSQRPILQIMDVALVQLKIFI